MKTKLNCFIYALALLALSTINSQQSTCFAQNTMFTYQGQVQDNGSAFTGIGQFKFALGTNVTAIAQAYAIVNGSIGLPPYGVDSLGAITNVILQASGGGYTSIPSVTVNPLGGGSGAVITANVSGGAVTGFNIVNAGNGYYNGAYLTISAPPPSTVFNNLWSNDGTTGLGQQPAAAVNVPVTNGLFTVVLGNTAITNMTSISASLFTQPNLQLQIWFNDGTHGFADLNPPQTLTPTPYAAYAATISAINIVGTIPAANLPASVITNGYSGYWNTNGNAGANPANGAFLGTTDNQPLEMRVNGSRALRLEPGPSGYGAPNVIGGAPYNFVSSGVESATIGGGGAINFEGSGPYTNSVTGDAGTVSGGLQNTASAYGTIAGGVENTAGPGSSIGGGGNNYTSNSCTIGGGDFNVAVGDYSTVSGGYNNFAGGYGDVVAGGGLTLYVGRNLASGTNSVVGGGAFNLAITNYATVPGGYSNLAGGQFSFAAGSLAQATNNASFVWSDGSVTTTSITNNTVTMRATNGFRFFTGNGAAGAQLLANATSWTTLSDRNAKKNFSPVNAEAVLDKLAAIPIQQWNYKWESDKDTPNIGPMAQDFKAAFYPGRDDKGISTLEFDGVELAAIQGLNQKLNEKDAEIQDLKARLEKLEQLMSLKNGGVK
jgi:hypothetical protein